MKLPAAPVWINSWLRGPEFLKDVELPNAQGANFKRGITADDPEVKKAYVHLAEAEEVFSERFKRFSS